MMMQPKKLESMALMSGRRHPICKTKYCNQLLCIAVTTVYTCRQWLREYRLSFANITVSSGHFGSQAPTRSVGDHTHKTTDNETSDRKRKEPAEVDPSHHAPIDGAQSAGAESN